MKVFCSLGNRHDGRQQLQSYNHRQASKPTYASDSATRIFLTQQPAFIWITAHEQHKHIGRERS